MGTRSGPPSIYYIGTWTLRAREVRLERSGSKEGFRDFGGEGGGGGGWRGWGGFMGLAPEAPPPPFHPKTQQILKPYSKPEPQHKP